MSKNTTAQQLPLLLPSLNVAKQAANQANVKVKIKTQAELWLCLFVPRLSLELLGQQTDTPKIVLKEVAGRFLVHTPCDLAADYGVSSNMTVNAAYALCPDLQLHHRDLEKEKTQLIAMADWAQQYTPMVSIAEGNNLLLEISASLDLFGGLSALKQRIETDFSRDWAYSLQTAVSPTPLASRMLARFSDAPLVERSEDLRSILGKLPITELLLNEKKLLEKLQKIGVANLQDLWRLPRASLARRFGQRLIKHLDKLLAYQADPQPLHQEPVFFDASIELPYEASNNKSVSIVAGQLLQQLESFLRQRDASVAQLIFRLSHFDKTSQDLPIGFRQCTRDAEHIHDLLEEHLSRLRLSAAVCEVRLLVNEILPFIAHNKAVFSAHVLADQNIAESNLNKDPDWQNLLDQLQNRFGHQAVQYLQAENDHRPECAWSYQSLIPDDKDVNQKQRPLWLLEQAQHLSQRNNKPYYHGVLHFISGPERIESGWWQESQNHRDYYVVQDVSCRYLWVYRDLQSKQWYLHGFFK